MTENKEILTSFFASKLDNINLLSSCNYDLKAITDTVSSNSLLNENINRSIETLNKILSSQLESSNGFHLPIPIIAAIIGAFSAYSFNYFHWKMVEKKKKNSELLLMLSTLITELETLAVNYWSRDQNKEDRKDEVYIKSRIRLLTKYKKQINKNKNSNKDIIDDLESFGSDIFDLTTGDDFEMNNRKASKQKAINISYRCSDIRAIISCHY